VANDLFSQPALWGGAGAFIYGAPLFSTCLFTAKESGGSCIRCTSEFLTALAIGTFAAASAAPLILEIANRDSAASMRAAAALTGLLANKVAPMIISAAPDAVVEWVSRMFKGRDK
jgi:hypothetical protein